MDNKYTELLKSIIENSDYLKSAAVFLLGKGIITKNGKKRLFLVAYSVNILFAYMDEIGKFYLIKSQYPKKIDKLDLKKIGFYCHDVKLKKLIRIIRERQARRGSKSPFSDKNTLKILRKLKDTTLYIDYKNKKIIRPLDSMVIKSAFFPKIIETLAILGEMAKADLKLFIKSYPQARVGK